MAPADDVVAPPEEFDVVTQLTDERAESIFDGVPPSPLRLASARERPQRSHRVVCLGTLGLNCIIFQVR